jgi:hypothetical protein
MAPSGFVRIHVSRFTFHVLRFTLQKPHHRISMLEHFSFVPERWNFQRIAFGVTEDKQAAGSQ